MKYQKKATKKIGKMTTDNRENNGTSTIDDTNNIIDEESVTKQEKRIQEKAQLKLIRKAVEEALNHRTPPINNNEDVNSFTGRRLGVMESQITETANTIDDLSFESLRLGKRLVKISKQVNTLELEYIKLTKDMESIKERVCDIKESSKDITEKTYRKEDMKYRGWNKIRNTILLLTAIIAIIISIISIIYR